MTTGRVVVTREGDGDQDSPIDALLPSAMARRAEEIGVRKVEMAPMSLLALAVLAGAFIALGGVFATAASAGAGPVPWGAVRVLAGVAFSLGLVLVLVGGAELFTGNNLIVMAWAGGRVGTSALLRNWAIVFAGNFLGAAATALAVYVAGVHRFGGGAWGAAAICNALVCLAVWMTYSARTTTDRVLAIVPPISAFVATGFGHSIANMYFVPLGILVATFDPAFAAARGLSLQGESLTWAGFLFRNLVLVTIGNVVGGSLFVGAIYWFVYLRPQARGSRLA